MYLCTMVNWNLGFEIWNLGFGAWDLDLDFTTLFYLLGSVLSSTIIALIFKAYERYDVDSFQAIVVNYLVCVVVGSLLIWDFPVEAEFAQEAWFPAALVLGAIFISTFYTVALTVQNFGVTVAVVLQKMSIILSVIFAIWMYNESVSVLKITGILLALAAVVLTNISPNTEEKKVQNRTLLLLLIPAYVFFACGAIEALLLHTERSLLDDSGDIRFTILIFSTAGIIGLIFLIINIIRGKTQVQSKHIIGGIALGIPNFFSVYFLVLVLGRGIDGSIIFPINNISIIVLAAILAWIIFKEKLSLINIAGILIAVISIVLMALAV